VGRRVLVRCYHGLGDTIQFLRFIPALRKIAAHVTLFCQPPLLSLVRGAKGVDRLLPLHDGKPEADFDVDIEIMQIPHALRLDHEAFRMKRPYLRADEIPPAELARRPAHELSVGLVWEVGDWDKRRCIPSSVLSGLQRSGVRFYSLQLNPAAGAIEEIGAFDLSTPDIARLAARLKQLDFVLCVDTMVAHLAGAIGCEAWIMLHSDCDWRWPASGARSIWYPAARLFHQNRPGDWTGVIKEVADAIGSRVRSQPAGHTPAARSRGGAAEAFDPGGSTASGCRSHR